MTDGGTALALPNQAPGSLTSNEVLRGLHTVRSVLAPDLSEDELKLFALVAARSGLDPFAKQIYAVKRQGRVTFQTGIDGYRSIAERTGLYDGQDEPEYGPACGCGEKRPDGHPEYATVRVYRKGVARPIAATAYWHEYKPEQGQSGRQDAMWVRMPRVMIAKVAEALALRKAFPYDPVRQQGIGADLYTADEMSQADRQARQPATQLPGLQQRLEARRTAQQAAAATEPAADPAAEEVEGEAHEVEERSAFDDTPATASDLLERLRDLAEEHASTAAATPEQIAAVRASAFADWPSALINAGIEAAFGSKAKGRPTAGHIEAIGLAADSLGPEAFREQWTAMVAGAAE